MSSNSTTTGDTTLDYFQVACAAISIYSSFEVLALAFTTFRKYDTLYFWSICGCAFGCILFAGGFLDLFYFLYLPNSTIYRPLFILTFGWYGMVTGFALVMYSRLYLVMVPKQYIQYVKYFIIYNIIFSHFPTTVLTFGANIYPLDEQWVFGYAVMEKIQMTFFCIQEVILGALYLNYTRKLRFNKKVTALVRQTLYINVIVLCLDISMLICEYANLYHYQIMLKVVVYSVKLKLEFFILNILSKSLRQDNNGTATYDSPKVLSGASTAGGRAGKEIAPAAFGSEIPESSRVDIEVVPESRSESQSAKGGDA